MCFKILFHPWIYCHGSYSTIGHVADLVPPSGTDLIPPLVRILFHTSLKTNTPTSTCVAITTASPASGCGSGQIADKIV